MKSKWLGWILGISVTLMAYQAWAEDIAISTYYPSPYGSYTTLDATNTLNVGPNGAPTIVMTGATGTVTASGAVSAASLSAGTTITGGSLSVSGAVNGDSVTAANAVSAGSSVTAGGAVSGTSLVTNGMTIRGASTGAGELQVATNGGKYYCYAVYA